MLPNYMSLIALLCSLTLKFPMSFLVRHRIHRKVPALHLRLSSGHSERRTLFHETSQEVAQKTRAALDAGLSIILCVGETLAQREAGETLKVVQEQLEPVVAALKPEEWRYVSQAVCFHIANTTCLLFMQQNCNCV